jgi:NADH-quinone oxidoreductase subunit G
VTDSSARAELSHAWDLDAGVLPGAPGRDTEAILAAARSGELGGLLVAGVDPGDLADPQAADAALDAAGFVVSFEIRQSAVTARADVVFPVAPPVEKPGAYLNWEGRVRAFARVLPKAASVAGPVATPPDARALHALAAELDVDLRCDDLGVLRGELAGLASMPLPGTESGAGVDLPAATSAGRPRPPRTAAATPAVAGPGQAVLATWHQLIDLGSMQDGDDHLAGTARPPVARISKATAADLGVADGDQVTVRTERGRVVLPAAVTDMLDGVVWLPTNSPGSAVRRTLGVTAGALVEISSGGGK